MTANVSKLLTMSIKTSPISDYDPYNTHKEERPVSRVNGKGLDNYMKSRGSFSINDWHSHEADYASPRQKERTEDTDIVRNKNDGFRMKDMLGGYPDPAIQKKGPRVKPEAQKMYNRSQGTIGRICFKEYGTGIESVAASKDIHKSKGISVSNLIHNYGYLPESSRPVPRVKQEAADNSNNARGSIDKVFRGEPPTERPAKSATPRMTILW